MPSLASRTKKDGTPNWPFGHRARKSRDREHRQAVKRTTRRTVMSVPVLSEAEVLEAQGLSPGRPRENRSDLAQSDFGKAPCQTRIKVASTAASNAAHPVTVQSPNGNETNTDMVYPHIEIDLGRIFLDFIKENKDLIKGYNSRLPYTELDLSKEFLGFISKNQDLVKSYMSRLADQVPINTLPLSSNAVSTSPQPSTDSDRTFSDSASSSDEADIDDDLPQPTMALDPATRSQHIAAAMKETDYSKPELLASYGRREIPIGGRWAQRVNLLGSNKCDRCRRLPASPCVQFAKEDMFQNGLSCVGCRTSKVKCSLNSA